MLKILIADDSILARSILREILSTAPDFRVVGDASNGRAAVEQCGRLKPDIVIMDIEMPTMNGLEATRCIRAFSPVPILIFTNQSASGLPFKALAMGANDFLNKPSFETLSQPDFVESFLERLRTLSKKKPDPISSGPGKGTSGNRPLRKPSLLAIGASTGGPRAILSLLTVLPKPLVVPIVLIQHIETGFDRSFAAWIGSESGHPACLAAEGMKVLPGTVYVAPTDWHLSLRAFAFHLGDGDRVLNQKPSIDVFFSSVAREYGSSALGVLLTGMGKDGAEGCRAILNAGGSTIVQDQASSLIFGMPKAAIEAGGAGSVLPLDEIGKVLASLLSLDDRKDAP